MSPEFQNFGAEITQKVSEGARRGRAGATKFLFHNDTNLVVKYK